MTIRSNGSYIGPRPAGPSASVASGIWDLRTAERQKRASAWPSPAPTDPDFANVSLLLHMDGSNGSTTFTDSSSNSLLVTPSGNANTSTAQSKFGGASAYFDGTGAYLSVSANSNLAFGTSDFTVEMFLYFSVLAQMPIYETPSLAAAGARNTGFLWYLTSSNKLEVFSGNSNRGESATALTAGGWYHVAVVRSSGTFSYFIDGVKDATTFDLTTNFTDSSPLVGRFCDSNGYFSGYIDDLRITKGVARYTANFTPPTAAFPDQ